MSAYDKYAVKQEFRNKNEAVIDWIDFYEKVIPEDIRDVISIDQFVGNVPYLIEYFSRKDDSISNYGDILSLRYVSKATYKTCANAANTSISGIKNKISDAVNFFRVWLNERLFSEHIQRHNKLGIAIIGTLIIDGKDSAVQNIMDRLLDVSVIYMADYVKLFFKHPKTVIQFLKLKK